MDAKNRSIGIDKDYLDKQVEEKRRLEGVLILYDNNDFMLYFNISTYIYICISQSLVVVPQPTHRSSKERKIS